MPKSKDAPLSPQQVPDDLPALVLALVQVREHADAAVAVHDVRLTGRLVQLGLAQVSAKGLRGTTALAEVVAEYGPQVIGPLLCTPLAVPTLTEPAPVVAAPTPTPPTWPRPAEAVSAVPQPRSAPVPQVAMALCPVAPTWPRPAEALSAVAQRAPIPLVAVASAPAARVREPAPPTIASLLRKESAKSGAAPASLASLALPASVEPAPEPAPSFAPLESAAPAEPVEPTAPPSPPSPSFSPVPDSMETKETVAPSPVAAPPVAEPETLIDQATLAQLERAVALRASIVTASKELHEILQPLTDAMLLTADPDTLLQACTLYPVSPQRSALLARLKEMRPVLEGLPHRA